MFGVRSPDMKHWLLLFRVAFGLASLLVSLLIGARAIGLLPDRLARMQSSRAAVLDVLAIEASMAAQRGDLTAFRTVAEMILARDRDLVHIALTDAKGTTLFGSDQPASDEQRTIVEATVRVPILINDAPWGTLELQFGQVTEQSAWILPSDPDLMVALGIGVIAAILYGLYLKTTLGPTIAAAANGPPERVRDTLNTLFEGVLLIDRDQRIALANQAFSDMSASFPNALEGANINELGIETTDSDREPPWTQAVRHGKSEVGRIMEINIGGFRRRLSVNCTPIYGDRGEQRGALATFHDLTELERRHAQLRKLLGRLRRSRVEIRSRAHQQSALAEIGRCALSSDSLDSVFHDILTVVRRTLDAIGCAVEETPIGSSPVVRAFVREKPTSASNGSIVVGADVGPSSLGKAQRFPAIVAGRQRPYGRLVVFVAPDRSLQTEEMNFLTTAANVLASVIERTRAEVELRETLDALESRVAERTADLSAANEQLRKEVLERQRIELALRQSEGNHRALLDAIPDLMMRISDIGAFLDVRGASKHETSPFDRSHIGRRMAEVLDLDVAERFQEYIRAAIETGSIQVFEYQMTTDDAVFDFEIRLVVSGDHEVLAIIRDITEQKRLAREILEVAGREQRRIGHDLHDGLGQQLTGISMFARVLQGRLESKGMTEEAKQAAKVVSLVNESISTARALARGLFPVELEQNGLASALEDLSANVETLFGIHCTFESDAGVLVEDNNAATHLFHIAKEAVNNAVKHAQPTRVAVRLENEGDAVRLSVVNDGAVWSQDSAHSSGMGLRIMRYRARMINVAIQIEPFPTGGAAVQCLYRPASPEL